MTALLIPADPAAPFAMVEVFAACKLKQLQNLVGGWVENVPVPIEVSRHLTIYCNEEGILLGLRPNDRITHLLDALGWPGKGLGSMHGNVVILGPLDENGDHQELPASIIDTMNRLK